jgi:SAM-dependent methyltransferase
MSELLIGCGNSRTRKLAVNGERGWKDLVTLDNDPRCDVQVVHDLETLPLPFQDESFDEIHAYEVLEHIGRQGDAEFFFAQFSDFWRLLKPGGHFCGSVPLPTSKWAFGDPSHKRVLPRDAFLYLDQARYTEQVGKTTISDFRHIYRADFVMVYAAEAGASLFFALRAVKPSRIT